MVAGTPGPARPILELHFPRSISGTLTLTRAGLGAVAHGLVVTAVGIRPSQRPPVPTAESLTLGPNKDLDDPSLPLGDRPFSQKTPPTNLS